MVIMSSSETVVRARFDLLMVEMLQEITMGAPAIEPPGLAILLTVNGWRFWFAIVFMLASVVVVL
jgi:hypothetical protein